MYALPNPSHVAWAPDDDRPAYELAYDLLRRELLTESIPPGARMREVELADRLQLSRTPVREALRRLESDGFVQRMPGGGLVVTPTGQDDLGDLALLRTEIDGLAARLAAARGRPSDWEHVKVLADRMGDATDDRELTTIHRDFHREIYAIAFSPRMTAFFDGHLLPYIQETVSVGPGRGADPGGARTQHLTLLRALSSGDVDRAVRASREHAEAGAHYARSRTDTRSA